MKCLVTWVLLLAWFFGNTLMAVDWQVRYTLATSTLNDASLINPSNFYNIPNRQNTLKLRSLFSENLNNDVVFSGNLEYQLSDKRLNSDNDNHRVIIDSLLLTYTPYHDLSFDLGKNQTNFGSSVQTNILNLFYSTTIYRRQNEGIWALSIKKFTNNNGDIALSFIPHYDTNLEQEFKNRNQDHMIRLQWNTFFDNIDFRTVLSSELGDTLYSFWAISLSSEAPYLADTVFYIDAKVVNKEQPLTLSKSIFGSTTRYSISQTDGEYRVLSPFLFGINTLFFGKLDVRFEYLYNGYGLSKSESDLLYEALENDSRFSGQFSDYYSGNRLGKHYVTLSGNVLSIMKKTNVWFSWNLNATDFSSYLRTGGDYQFNNHLNLTLALGQSLSNNKQSEYGSYIYDYDLQVGLSLNWSKESLKKPTK